VASYPYPTSYRTWPGPNSNTFTAWVGRAVPELRLKLPSTAIGKDFLPGAIADTTPSGTGVQLSLFGLTGLAVGWDEGIEVNRAARIAAAAHGGQVLMSGCTWALLKDDRPTGAELRDLGEHRLKDFPGPEHIYQVAIDGLPADFPALRALAATPSNPPLAATPTNLTNQLTRFIGRERELEETKARLLKARLLTISGAGGLGKTRLSIELAASVSDVFNAGVWFIELAGLSDRSLVPHAVATVVGLRESATTMWKNGRFLAP